MKKELEIVNLLETQYKDYSYYVISSRAISSVVDGLKPVQRRLLWTAYKYFKNDKVKVSKLTGNTMAIHPHGDMSISSACCNMAQSFCGSNNVPYFNEHGAFGSKIVGPGNGIGAARYVSVSLSDNFNKIMAPDIGLIETKPSYDDSDEEPVTFLPLVPTILLNPVQGIAVGFACDILPRKLEDIVHCQLQHLEGKSFHDPKVFYNGFNGTLTKISDNVWESKGVYTKTGKKMVITELPLGSTREAFVTILDNLEEKEIISSYTDDCTDDFKFSITLKSDLTDEEIIKKFKLVSNLNENLTVIWFDGKVKKSDASTIIREFTDYRLKLYLKRYKADFYKNKEEFEFKKDLLKVIVDGIFKKFPDLSRKEIKELLLEKGIQEKHIDKIVSIPIYRFGKDEVDKLKKELIDLKVVIENLIKLIKDENLRKDEYKKELKMLKK